ncbi:MAG: lipid biosynthesis B12-binding/radical SAM protein [Deltaproteobacteria bacterium]|nr:lipid biosynthesis B12-binding/radical SAM protein [Candidatus Tharpella sp.]
MSRVLLISTNLATTPYVVYPLGMAVIARALNDSGHQVEQFDILAAENDTEILKKMIAGFNPDFICFSLRNIDNTDSLSGDAGWYLEQARATIAEIKTLNPAPTIIGGPAFSLMPEAILEYLEADYGVVGEGEEALPRLLDEIRSGKQPPAIAKGVKPLTGEQFATPQFHPDILNFYRNRSGIANLQSKRGCPHHCHYCTYPELEGHRFRRRPPATVVDDIEYLIETHNIDTLFFVDSVFNDNQGHHLAIAEEILNRNLKIRWSAFFRPAGLNLKDLKLLQRSGLFAVESGSDALTETTLKGLGKGFSLNDIFTTHKFCQELKLPIAHYLIFGGPLETPVTLAEGIRNLDKLDGGVLFLFSGLRILPGTNLYQRALQEGVITTETSLLRPTYYASPEIDSEIMNQKLTAACKGRRQRLFPPTDALERMQIMQRFGFKGILWDQLVQPS